MLHQDTYALDVTSRGGYRIVGAGGELDIAAVPQLRDRVRASARRSSDVVVDLGAVTFMDTFALRALIELDHEAVASAEWSLHVVAGAGIQRLLDLAGAREALRWLSAEQLAR